MDSTSQKEYVCSICEKAFLDPVTLPCKHNFCRSCLYFHWESVQASMGCPTCGGPCPQKTWKSNLVLNTRGFLSQRQARSKDPQSFAEPMCTEHQQSKSYFCDVLKECLCVLCCRSESHKDHQHCWVDWKAQGYRQQLVQQMNSLLKKTQENQRIIEREVRLRETWKSHVDLRKKMIREEYWRMHADLYEEERCHLEALEKESNIIYQQLSESEDSKGPAGTNLRKMYGELEKMCRIPDLELIQQFEILLERSEAVQQCVPQPVDTCLSSWTITGLTKSFSNYQACDFSVYATLSTYDSPLLEELRYLFLGCDGADDVKPLKRKEYFLAWATECFTSGQHCWHMNMGEHRSWAVGFCSDSWTLKNDMELTSEGIFLLLYVEEGDQCSLFTTSPLRSQHVEKPLDPVGVMLDYERGSVSFVDVYKSSLICRISCCVFSTPLRPFVCFKKLC